MENELREYGQKATVVIATDGEATDGDVSDAMRPLQNLPVWVVIRLCTNEQVVVGKYHTTILPYYHVYSIYFYVHICNLFFTNFIT